MRTIALLGSTGSIGMSTLDLVRQFPERFKVDGLVAGENLKRLASQIKEFAPRCVAIKNEHDIPRLRKLLGNNRVRFFTVNGERPQFPRPMKSMSLWRLLSAERDCCRLLLGYESAKKSLLPIKRRW